MTNFNIITRGVKLLMVFALSILGNWTAFPGFYDRMPVNSHHAHANSHVKWNAHVTNVDLVGNEHYDIYTFGDVYLNHAGKLKAKDTHAACIRINNVKTNDDFDIFVVLFERPASASINDIFYCSFHVATSKPINKKDSVSISFGDDGRNSEKSGYSSHFDVLSLSIEKQKLLSLLRENQDKIMTLSFPVDSVEYVDSVNVKFNPDNLGGVLPPVEN